MGFCSSTVITSTMGKKPSTKPKVQDQKDQKYQKSSSQLEEVDREDWMQWFLGASEKEVIKNKSKFMDARGNLKHKDGRVWPGGVFTLPTVDELRSQVEQMPSIRAAEKACP